jgi:hypothetical protein
MKDRAIALSIGTRTRDLDLQRFGSISVGLVNRPLAARDHLRFICRPLARGKEIMRREMAASLGFPVSNHYFEGTAAFLARRLPLPTGK